MALAPRWHQNAVSRARVAEIGRSRDTAALLDRAACGVPGVRNAVLEMQRRKSGGAQVLLRVRMAEIFFKLFRIELS